MRHKTRFEEAELFIGYEIFRTINIMKTAIADFLMYFRVTFFLPRRSGGFRSVLSSLGKLFPTFRRNVLLLS